MPRQDNLLNSVRLIAREAGQIILEEYRGGPVKVTYKEDNSPVTRADTRSNDYIVRSLHKLTPNIPIVSEESLSDKVSKSAKSFWLVDPLDGTKDFLNKNDQFTVNIALIGDGSLSMGVVFAPALNLLYYASKDEGAWLERSDGTLVVLPAKAAKRPEQVIIVSRAHLDKRTKTWLKTIGPHKLIQIGSSLKLCYLTDGTADIYPRFSPLMKWDIAAADFILRQSGGAIIQSDNTEPTYEVGAYNQLPFIAYADRHSKP